MQSFAQLLSSSVGLCVLASLSLKYLFGSLRLLLLLHVFVVDEIVKVELIPGNLGQKSENKLLEERLQHPAALCLRAYEKAISESILKFPSRRVASFGPTSAGAGQRGGLSW